MVLIVISAKGYQGWAHPEADEIQEKFYFFLVDAVSPLVKYLTDLLIIVSLIYGYMFTAYIYAIVTFSLLTPVSSSFSLRSDDWTMVKDE